MRKLIDSSNSALVYLAGIMLICVIIGSCVTACGSKSNNKYEEKTFSGGYFIIDEEWSDNRANYMIVHAKDTCVKYMITESAHRYDVTPLYNADGSLQVYNKQGGV